MARFRALLSSLKALAAYSPESAVDDAVTGEAPLRAELFTAAQMERHGWQLASIHVAALTQQADRLLPRLADNRRALLSACSRLSKGEGPQFPAAEWLLDNIHLFEEEIRTAERHLPKGYSRELPRLSTGPSAGLPRVYDLAIESVAHGDGQLGLGSLTHFFAAYQQVQPLRLGELWAIPIMLRLALIENLRRVAVAVAASRDERNLAAKWSDRMLDVAHREPKGLILVVADMTRSDPSMSPPFVAELVRRLHGHSTALAMPLSWLEQRLAEINQTTDQLVQLEAQQQAADQVTVSNSIGSLRLLAATDWSAFVESLSTVDKTLRTDPANTYSAMDFATRDTYRHAIEQIARDTNANEDNVAHSAIAAARDAANADPTQCPRQAHVGYHLIGPGRFALEQMSGSGLHALQRLQRLFIRHPLAWFSTSIITLSILFPVLALYWANSLAPMPWLSGGLLWVVGAALLLGASHLAVAWVNWVVTLFAVPKPLPRMDFSLGIPSASRTLVVVPTMLDSEAGVAALIEALEVRFLANRDTQLQFGLLTDFHDYTAEQAPGDDILLRAAITGVESLNAKYAAAEDETEVSSRFFLFHRPRRWNAREGVWMGRERKRGKLGELNALLRGGSREFAAVVGNTAQLQGVRYVITLDTDTQLPRDAAWKLVGTMAHPLNQPRFGAEANASRVVEGYGILQPRVGVSLLAANCTRYGRLHGSDSGIDPYTRAVSDVYQDLYGEGSFIGKGIYDIDAFEQALAGQFPDNLVLSHDLLEGCYARSGFLSDVDLVEDSPTRYDADIKRRHRWIRGDWQVISWLWPRVRRAPNPLSALSRFKILDNLRRSLVPIALVACFALGWTALQPAWLWTLVVSAVLFVPSLLGPLTELVHKPTGLPIQQHLKAVLQSLLRSLAQAGLSLACLVFEACVSADAIARTLWRLHGSRRRLLEWEPSANAARVNHQSPAQDFLRTVRRMWVAPALSAVMALGLVGWQPDSLAAASLPLLAWFFSPAIVWWISQPLVHARTTLNEEQVLQMRELTRRTWAFFETFVTAEDNFLPPDNMQEKPELRVAHRTSPTNIGLSLLANLAARDFGYLTEGQLIERTSATFNAMDKLERYHGHFLNWYDTRTLEPLRPAYVSSVDSGNLAGHLLTLRAGLLMLAAAPLRFDRLRSGLTDTLELLRKTTTQNKPDGLVRLATVLDEAFPADAETGTRPAAQALADLHNCALLVHAKLIQAAPAGDEALLWSRAMVRQCAAAQDELLQLDTNAFDQDRRMLLCKLAQRAGELAEMEFGFLYDPVSHLLAIGYNVDERRRDTGSYDLLASEARLAIFIGIAQAQLPQQAWFALGRHATSQAGRAVLLSWSGSMFEYLMPMLVMPTFDNTLLEEAMRGAVARQIDYGNKRNLPWGVSESGYNLTDSHLNYQYRAFGVPGLGLKRGLGEDMVIAPYATVLALMVDPAAAADNLQRLTGEGLAGLFGYYEAADYTPLRLRRGETCAVVRSYMVHHQGMSLLALAHVLLDQPMQKRFGFDPQLRATLLLLQERIPKAIAFHETSERIFDRASLSNIEMPLRIMRTPHTPSPEVQLLSNGRYLVMLTNAGGGYSRWKELAISRWREDTVADSWGSFCYLRDVETGSFWSSMHQPTRRKPDLDETIFSEGRAEYRRQDAGIEAYTEIVVSPEDDIELRRLQLTNLSATRRTIEITTYTEPVLSPAAADAQHPAFSKLFLQTEILKDPAALLCARRPRSNDDSQPWMFHLVAPHGAKSGPVSHETDRARFIGRGRSLQSPAALRKSGPLSGTAGAVLDPVLATRCVITLEPDQTATIDLVYGVAESREACVALVHKYRDRHLADRVFELAWTHSQVNLRQINATEADAQLYARLANSVMYSEPALRAAASVLVRNRRAQSGLWGYEISGDLPIVLLQLSDSANIQLVHQLVQAHAWWRLKGLAVDLVIWNEERDVYRQRLHEQILGLIAGSIESRESDRPGGIFVRQAAHIALEDRILLQSVARAIISDRLGTFAEQVDRKRIPVRRIRALEITRRMPLPAPATAQPSRPQLLFDNGLGGFRPDGREYIVAPPAGSRPPAPWANVIANPRFGTVITDAGSSYTWCENAHELRLSPWHNDAVTDECGEVLYLRDEDTGHVWHPTSLPQRDDEPDDRAGSVFTTRHGFGYSVFEHSEFGIHSELTVFVANDAAVKFSRLVLTNQGTRPRNLSATSYVEWVLGDMRAKTSPHLCTEIATDTGAVLARNRYSNQFGNWVAFLDIDEGDRSNATMTCDRDEFIGRNGSLRRPAAMGRAHLSGRSGVALDACAAIQVMLRLEPGQSREITFRLGMGRSLDEATQLVRRFRGSAATRHALEEVNAHWRHTLGAVQVKTPDPAINLLANGWLVYQTLGCRMMARSGFYQSGGAFGFRDQLQDAMALVHTSPDTLREHLLVCASRQFPEGDVQHWWHPPSGHGVRTQISDDYLWLPLALCRYLQATNDTGVLEERVPFLEGRVLGADEESYYDLPARSGQEASLYDHAVLALLHGLRFGAHGLPLMGAGDWNDGMNRVGHHGQGESVWLGFFLCDMLRQFAPLARARGDEVFANRCETERSLLAQRLEANAWDGAWYRRAWFDDGQPLGSSSSVECQIDSIAQSWSVLSGVASPDRASRAMDSLDARLVQGNTGVVRLLDPPFDRQGPDPGYIAGYLPGVRENGGQYTHAAVWAAMAFAAQADAKRAWQVMDLINPLNHARTADEVAVYKVEPYVVAADVYSVAPHTGRGGWSWYTGSAGWMYRLVIESLLGLRLQTSAEGAMLRVEPCVPADWTAYSIDYRYRETTYRLQIEVLDEAAALLIELDGIAVEGVGIPLVDDGLPHKVLIRIKRFSV
ncbi:MAG: cyclic beta 1-2 glucan synthetase [Limnobacter sp.]|uniref:GH36-type glycosyl hydrolase domain-containing protein n=1 Tax=Limnobacter sp. TaxID=2003368 RepID=UPI0022C3797E|nr:glucoamylase family protein [Limnobacter sp.]MCZ8014356.1 cyclic beta 1-2 glucan synthetase [Limnobacter sp.]